MPKVIIGSHTIEQMRSMKGLTFPRVHLYNANGVLVTPAARGYVALVVDFSTLQSQPCPAD